MYATATEVKNNFGRYLDLCKRESVIITKNGKKQALLLHYPRDYKGFEAGEPIHQYGTSPAKSSSVTYREFLEITETSDARYELIDGEVYMLPSPSFFHQKILLNLISLFLDYFKSDKTCTPLFAPLDIELVRESVRKQREVTEDDISIVQPDIMILCNAENMLDEKEKFKGTPVLVVEVLSPSTRGRDLFIKGGLYEESGIEEYWVVDPVKKTVTLFSFKDFSIADNEHSSSGDMVNSLTFPGLSISVDTLFS